MDNATDSPDRNKTRFASSAGFLPSTRELFSGARYGRLDWQR